MSERPGSKEILERIRAAKPAQSESRPKASQTPQAMEPAPGDDPSRPLTLQQKLAAIRSQTVATQAATASPDATGSSGTKGSELPVVPQSESLAAVPADADPGRPLSIREKLAAARNASSTAEPATPQPVPAPAAAPKTSDAAAKPLSVAEKLAMMRSSAPGVEAKTAVPAATPSVTQAVVESSQRPEVQKDSSRSREQAANLRKKSQELQANPLPRVVATELKDRKGAPESGSSAQANPLLQTVLILGIGLVALVVLVACLWYVLMR